MNTRRRSTVCRLAMVALWMVVAVQATAGPRFGVTVAGGASFPIRPSELSDLWDTGFLMSGGLEARFTHRWRADLEVGFASHHGSNVVIPVTLNGMFDLEDRGSTKPYVLAGVGVYRFNTDGGTVTFDSRHGANYVPPDDETAFGAQLGVGVRTPLAADLDFAIDVLYELIATNGEATGFMPLRLRLIF